jgi:hypothetical protein
MALVNFSKLVYGTFGQSNMYSISAQTSQEGIKCTNAKEYLRARFAKSNTVLIYIYCDLQLLAVLRHLA